jgi:cell division protein FtsW
LGKGIKKLGGLPEAHSDFIFAVVGEESGFVGAVFVLLLFVLFAWRGYGIAFRGGDSFHRFLAFGLTSVIFLQAMLNIAVVAGLLPATGIPLPFFSSGGSSMLVSLTMCGLLLNLSKTVARQGRRY